MDVKCNNFMKYIVGIVIQRRGKLSFTKCKVTEYIPELFLGMFLLTGVRFFYYKEEDNLYCITSLQKSPEGCKIYLNTYKEELEYVDLKKDIEKMFEKGTIMYPLFFSPKTNSVTFEISQKGIYKGKQEFKLSSSLLSYEIK